MNKSKVADVVNKDGIVVNVGRGPLIGLPIKTARYEAKAFSRLCTDGPFRVVNIRKGGV